MSQVLPVIERLLVAAGHPDIVKVTQFGPDLGPWGPTVEKSKVKTASGVKVTFQSTATASLSEAIGMDELPVGVPDLLPPIRRRAPRLAIFTAQLLDVARPPQFKAWRLVAFQTIGLEAERGFMPFGVSIVLADGSRMLLHATSTGPTSGDEPAEDPYGDYVIPEGVKTACREANAATATLA